MAWNFQYSRHRLGQGRRHRRIVPEAAEERVGLAEAEQVLGDGQFRHPRLLARVRSSRPAARAAAASRARSAARGGGGSRARRPVPTQPDGGPADERDAVADRREHADHARVVDDLVVEGAQRLGPFVGVLVGGQHAAGLQRVVDDDQPVPRQLGQDGLEVGVVGDLVGVDEDEVERALELRE